MNFADLLAGYRKVTQSGRDQLATLQARKLALEQELGKVRHAPSAKEDLRRMITVWVDAAGRQHTGALQLTLAEFARRPSLIPAAPLPGQFSAVAPGQRADLAGDSLAPGAIDMALCALFPDQVRAALLKAVDALPQWDEGLPASERAKRIEALERQINDVTSEAESLVEQARAEGIDLLMPQQPR